MANQTVQGKAVKVGAAGVTVSPAFTVIESLTFTPRFGGPTFEVANDQDVVVAYGLQTDGGDFTIETVFIDNTTDMNIQTLEVGDAVTFLSKVINNNVIVNTRVVSQPEVKFTRGQPTGLTFKCAWRPGVE
jgi:hypothetical protein